MKKKGFHRTKKFLKVACLAASLAMASWGGGGEAKAALALDRQLSGTINPIYDLTNVYVFYSVNSSGYAQYVFYDTVGSVPANSNKPFSFEIPDPSYFGGDTYTVFGVYNTGSGGSGVTVGMNTDAASYWIGKEWSALLPYTTEDDFKFYLQSGNTTELESIFKGFFVASNGAMSGQPLTLVNYTVGTYGGTANAQVVPLPPSLFLLAPGIGILLLRRRWLT
jgi:hypothetical protein